MEEFIQNELTEEMTKQEIVVEKSEDEEEIDYEEAKEKAREQLYVGDNRFEVYLNIENPAIVGETILLDKDSLDPGYDPEDFDSEEEYEEKFNEYITKYGDRNIEELKIENVDGYDDKFVRYTRTNV